MTAAVYDRVNLRRRPNRSISSPGPSRGGTSRSSSRMPDCISVTRHTRNERSGQSSDRPLLLGPLRADCAPGHLHGNTTHASGRLVRRGGSDLCRSRSPCSRTAGDLVVWIGQLQSRPQLGRFTDFHRPSACLLSGDYLPRSVKCRNSSQEGGRARKRRATG